MFVRVGVVYNRHHPLYADHGQSEDRQLATERHHESCDLRVGHCHRGYRGQGLLYSLLVTIFTIGNCNELS